MAFTHHRNMNLILLTCMLSASVFALPTPGDKASHSAAPIAPTVSPASAIPSEGKHSSAGPSGVSTTVPGPSASPSKGGGVSGSIPSPAGNVTASGPPSLSALFPVPSPLSQWTTLPGAPGALPLSDATLMPFKEMSQTNHSYGKAPDGTMAMIANYPQGSWNPTNEPRGGFSFYATGPSSVNITTAQELTFGYSVMFPSGFQWNLGGKLPGIYGGDNASNATQCSGGRRDPTCFSARLMWRADGAGEIYTYLPDPTESPLYAANAKICQMPNSLCNPTYGDSISRGAFSFIPGAWTTVSERVKLNTAGQADGELELYVGGKSVINATGIILRDSDEGRIRGIQCETFFGGNTIQYASPSDQQAYFADFSVAILSTL
ncbi:hypothetical protein DFH07DRAFT_889081, partial [Mycena maculata]